MSEHFIQWINIEKYKCFENFEAKDFKRINLIAGKNNVGKTALMEAIHINISSKEISNLAYALDLPIYVRNNLELINNQYLKNNKERFNKTQNYTSISNLHQVKYINLENNGIKTFEFKIDERTQTINKNDFSYTLIMLDKLLVIDKFGFTNNNLTFTYEFIQKKDKEEFLNSLINRFDKNIEKFKIIGDKPQCKLSNSEIFRDINEFGDGLKHYISIICALFACENGYLFIDEIDNGIHYSQLQKIWEIIFDISKEVNCQVFAVTHSLEMIKAYEKVIKNKNEDDISFIELGRDKNDNIKAQVLDKDMFLYEMENNHEVRGW